MRFKRGALYMSVHWNHLYDGYSDGNILCCSSKVDILHVKKSCQELRKGANREGRKRIWIWFIPDHAA